MFATQTTILGFTQMEGSTPAGGGESETGAVQGTPAPGPARQGPCGGGDSMTTLIFMLGIFVVFYFLLIRPQQKKAKEHEKMIKALQKGDQVVTNGGLIGRITGLTDSVLTVEISEKVRVRVLRSQVSKFDNNPAEKK